MEDTRVRKISHINLNYAELVVKRASMNVVHFYLWVGEKRCVATVKPYSKFSKYSTRKTWKEDR